MLKWISTSAKCKNHSWSTKGGYGPPGPPGPPWSTLIHIFGGISTSVDQSWSEWTRWTTGTTTPLGGLGAFRTTFDHAPTFPWYNTCFRFTFQRISLIIIFTTPPEPVWIVPIFPYMLKSHWWQRENGHIIHVLLPTLQVEVVPAST